MSSDGGTLKSCVVWVPQGVPAAQPDLAEDALPPAPAAAEVVAEPLDDDLAAELDIAHYDDDDNVEMGTQGDQIFGTGAQDYAVMANDPLIPPEALEEMEAENEVDFAIDGKTEYVLLVGSVEGGDACSYETYVYDRDESYIHHETALQAFPLCLTYLPVFNYRKKKHYVAVGSFLPVVEIYNNDKINKLEPEAILDDKTMHHDGPITAVEVCPTEPEVLLTASHDQAVILWNLNTLKPLKKLSKVLTEQINCARWHPSGAMFVCAGAAGALKFVWPATGKEHAMTLDEDVEAMTWVAQPDRVWLLVVANVKGDLKAFKFAEATGEISTAWETTVADGPVLCLCSLPQLVGSIVVGCESGEALVFQASAEQYIKVTSKEMNAGPLYNCQASPDLKSTVAFSASELVIWDMQYDQACQSIWQL